MTGQPPADAAPGRWLARLGQDAPAFGAAVRAADLALPVPACPGWTVGGLAGHLGRIHRWVTAILATGQPADEPAAEGDPRDWYDAGWPSLLTALTGLDPAAPCWNFGPPPRTAGFWPRRMAHETALHLIDVQLAAGVRADLGPPSLDPPEFAADGIDEVATMFLPRQVRLGRCPAPARAIEVVCPEGRWQLGDGAPVATLEGTASQLLLAVWRRTSAGGLTVTGDASAVADLLALPITA